MYNAILALALVTVTGATVLVLLNRSLKRREANMRRTTARLVAQAPARFTPAESIVISASRQGGMDAQYWADRRINGDRIR